MVSVKILIDKRNITCMFTIDSHDIHKCKFKWFQSVFFFGKTSISHPCCEEPTRVWYACRMVVSSSRDSMILVTKRNIKSKQGEIMCYANFRTFSDPWNELLAFR